MLLVQHLGDCSLLVELTTSQLPSSSHIQCQHHHAPCRFFSNFQCPPSPHPLLLLPLVATIQASVRHSVQSSRATAPFVEAAAKIAIDNCTAQAIAISLPPPAPLPFGADFEHDAQGEKEESASSLASNFPQALSLPVGWCLVISFWCLKGRPPAHRSSHTHRAYRERQS